jgi:cytochrome c553
LHFATSNPHGLKEFADRTCMEVFSSKPGTLRCAYIFGALAVSLLWTIPTLAEPVKTPVTLPVEVMGAEGSVAAVTVELPQASVPQIKSLWLQIHGLEYPDLAGVRVNHGPWVSLNNHSVTVAQPGLGYGGIGGAFATLKMTLPLAPGSVEAGENKIEFRFNRTNGVVSGFRVLAFNFLQMDGVPVLPPQTFLADDPEQWAPPLMAQNEIAEGQRLWQGASLRASSLAGAPAIRAHCGDCHARDGRDLKYFNYSNQSIIARSQFHGLSDQEGKEIASYIRALDAPHPGRPWNPPYQPGPGMQSRPGAELAAGAGLDAVLDEDSQTLRSLFGEQYTTAVTAAAFAPDGDLKLREIPIAFQMPDWNHWLPQVHPLDAWGEKFAGSQLSRMYEARNATPKLPDGERASFFAAWLKARSKFLDPPRMTDASRWSPALAQSLYATLLWQLVKTWEISHLSGMEDAGGDVVWANVMAAETAPATVNIPNNANGMAGSGLTNEYFNNAWYELQMLLNNGGHQHHGHEPVDWVYVAGHERELERRSGVPEPGRVLVTAIAATQSSDPTIGPQDNARGWRPEQTIDPRMMVAPEWSETFVSLAPGERRAIAQAWLQAWLAKCTSYPVVTYFRLAQLPGSYEPPKELRAISGGKVWESASRFRAAGVDAKLVHELEFWGSQYMAMSSLFQY